MPQNLANSGVLPAWLVIPAAALVMLILAASLTVAGARATPSSRRRIRIANGWVMLLITPLAAAGFALIDSATHPRLFVQTWILIIGLIGISVVLAVLDIINTARLARLTHRRRRLSAPLRLAQDKTPNEGGPNA